MPWRPRWVAGVVLASTATLACVAAAWQAHDNEAAAQLRFEPIGQRAVSEIADRMQRMEYGLKGLQGAATLVGPANFDRHELGRYIATRSMEREFPGVLSMGYVRRLTAADEAAFVADMHRQGFADFQVTRFAVNPGEHDVIVASVLPDRTESPVVGLDIASDPVRRTAALAAMRSGEPTLTSPLTLTRSKVGPGNSYLLLLPVYRPDSRLGTPQERESATVGWVYTSLAVKAILDGIDRPDDQISVFIRDVSGNGTPTVFSTLGVARWAPTPPIVTAELPVFGRTWGVAVRAEPSFVADLAQRRPRDVAGGGLLLSLLLTVVASAEARSAERARKTFAAQARVAAIVESSADAVIGESLDGIVTDWNEGAVRLFGYPAATAVGRTVVGLLMPRGREGEDVAIRAAIRSGRRIEPFDTTRTASDGREIEVSITASPIRDPDGRCIGFSKTVRDIGEQRSAQRALATLNATLGQQVAERVAQLDMAQRESAALLRSLDQLAIVVVADRSGRITEVNDNFCRISGYARDEVIGQDQHFVDSGLQANETRAIWEVIWTGRAWRGEICDRAKDGSLYWVDCSIAPFIGADGAIERFVSIKTDITDRKRVERELLQTNERFALAADSARTGVWEYDLLGQSLVWDDRMYDIYGRQRAPGSLPLEAWSESVHPDDRERVYRELQEAIDAVRSFDTTFRIVRPDQAVLHLKAAAHVVRDEHGTALRVTGVNSDVTERMNAEEAMAATESLLRHVGRLADVGGWLMDVRSEAMHWSEQTRLIHEVPDDFRPTLGSTLEFFGPDGRALLRQAIGRATNTGEGWDYELPFTTFTGRHLWVHSIGQAEFEGDRPVRLVGALQDITARRKAADLLRHATFKAEAANRAKSLFLANMSHEIRTPMNAVIGLSYLMERTPLNTAQADTMAKIKLASKALMGIIDNVLDLSKIEASEMRIEEAPFSMQQLLANLASILVPQAERKEIGFEIDVADGLPPILRGDATRVQQVLTNLLSNAIKFTERGSVRLTVQTVAAASGDLLRLRFVTRDTGIGIEPEALDSLFMPFVQADRSTTRRFGGTGLGLSIVKQLVTLMGGDLGASSTPAGSEFWVELEFPVGDEAASTNLLGAIDAPPCEAGLRGVRVLVVDDSSINLEVAGRILDGEGAVVQMAQDGQQALDLLFASPAAFDIVLMDVQMPVLDGLGATRQIRADPALASLPVIALTAGSLTSEQHEAEMAGFNAFVSKPLDPQKLVQLIRRFVRVEDAQPGRAPSRAPATAPPDWPAVEGIDPIVASRSLGGDAKLFRAMLGRMLDEFADLGAEPLTGAAALAPLASRLHRLAGPSAMLGASALRRSCTDAEAACREGGLGRAAELTGLVVDGLMRLRVAASRMIEHTAVPAGPFEPTIDLDPVDLEELLRLLRELNLGAPARFAAMAPQLRGALGESRYASMKDQVDNLQFADAATSLMALEA